ncbi:phage holin family protein [Hoylesella oralis]|uniref:phage holin family protein n=1 Tax=Hoylesella oralis TaxID=28134 RepID=UPI0028E63B58|nr:phage holin family protein [Hoylesella oralis]
MNFIVGYERMVGFTVMAIVLDAVWGIAASLLQRRFALSELARDTFAKIAVYGTAIFIFILIDKLSGISAGLTTSIICIGIILVELWSTAGSMLICYPNMPFLKLLKKALAGEIASKLNVRPEEVAEALETLHVKKV